jgi:hypothetical protein
MAMIGSYRELRVYHAAMDAAMKIFELTKRFPAEERYSMVDQIRRSSRSVCANLADEMVGVAQAALPQPFRQQDHR